MEERHGSENPISPLSDECRYVKLLFERLVDAYISAVSPVQNQETVIENSKKI